MIHYAFRVYDSWVKVNSYPLNPNKFSTVEDLFEAYRHQDLKEAEEIARLIKDQYALEPDIYKIEYLEDEFMQVSIEFVPRKSDLYEDPRKGQIKLECEDYLYSPKDKILFKINSIDKDSLIIEQSHKYSKEDGIQKIANPLKIRMMLKTLSAEGWMQFEALEFIDYTMGNIV